MPEVMSIEVDEEFDPRPPSPPFSFRKPDGSWNYGLIGGIAVGVILVLLLIFVVIKPFSSDPKPPPASTWSPKDPTKNLDYLETYPSDSAMVQSVQMALDSWASYYTTAKLDDLSDTFDLTGAQYSQLVAAQPTIAASPEAGLPAVVEIGPVGKVERNGNLYTVRVVSTWTKPGAATGRTYKWDIDMKSKSNKFLLVTTRDTPVGEKAPVDFCGAVDVVAGLDDAKTLGTELGKVATDKQVAKAQDVFEIKLKAWGLLQTSVAGTDSQNDVEAIVNEYETLLEATKTETSLQKVLDQANKTDISKERQAIETRASEECDADISAK